MSRLTIQDARELGHCVSGLRAFCADHGVDFRRFVKEGIPFEELEGIDDEMLRRALAHAKKKGARDGQ